METENDRRITELLLSESFRSWVLEGKDDGSWKECVDGDPDRYPEVIARAAVIMRNLRFQADRMEERQSVLLHRKIRQSLANAVPLPGVLRSRRTLLRYAAILIILLSGSWAGYLLLKEPAVRQVNNLTWKTEIAPKGLIKNLVLPDGTSVMLNAGSSLDYPAAFAGADRRVKLEGEAYFEVKHDELRPFRVATGEVETTVLGTSFNINTRDDKVQVALVEGKVEIENQALNRSMVLKPGEMAIAGKGSMMSRDFDPQEVLGWKDYILVYRSQTLEVIFKDLERIYGVKITLNKSVDQTKKYTGRFEREPLDSILKGIGYVSGFSSKRRKNEIILF